MVNIIVCFPRLEDAKKIRNLLFRNGYTSCVACTSAASAINAAERFDDGIIVSGYKLADMLYTGLYELKPEYFDLLLVASQSRLNDCVGNDVVCATMPLNVNDFINTVEMMSEAVIRRRKKLKSLPKKRNVEEQKTIDEAKKVLMEKNNMTEPEAHKYMQKTSMDSGNSLVETATMVLDIMLR